MDMFLTTVLICLLWLAVFIVKRLHKTKRFSKKYFVGCVGPVPNVLLGNGFDFVGGREVILKRLTQYTQTYGPIVKVHDGPFSMALVITDPKFMEYILSSTKIISKAFQYDFFHEWLGTGLLTSTGIKWRKRRKMLTPSFHFSILENFMDVFEKVGDIFIERLWEEVGKPSVDIYPLVSLCTLDIICEASMGISINAINDGDSEYVRSVKQMCQIPVDRTFDFTAPFQPWIHPITPNYFKQKRAIKVLHEHTDRVIDERIKNPINISDEDKDSVGMKKRLAFLDLLLTATIDGKPLSRMDIREEVDTFMFEVLYDTVKTQFLRFPQYSQY
ncbi:unnamed protein product [Acanthoscelides obtectus]|uniref:Cytochrome P450 n=1 Tax=Acanthoscelides obtectus TaxID=200917 RepID=A0A9P0K6Q3_ACAOB|nr:unnamed protein product [Acanthoscelides obtectus]CAK1622658.1 Cytochrome P450 4C1 [Acanthoscelides obtectus]